MTFEILEVGKIYPKYIGAPETIKCNITDAGVSIKILLNSPTKNELQQFSVNKDIQFKVLKFHEIIFILSKFGSLQWMDAPYSVFLTKNLSKLPSFKDGTGFSTTIEVYDTSSGKLCLLRYIGLPTEMSRKLVSYMEEQFQEPFDKSKMQIQLLQLYNTYSTKELVKFASGSYYIRHDVNEA